MIVYDSEADTRKHIRDVEHFMKNVIFNLMKRMETHDASKLAPPEKVMYDEFTPRLRELTYGSDEYKACLKEMGVALKHHYENNSHHPEHFENGINGMTLLDLIEMFCDWQAASLRHADGDVMKSLEINRARFGISDQLHQIFVNTVEEVWG